MAFDYHQTNSEFKKIINRRDGKTLHQVLNKKANTQADFYSNYDKAFTAGTKEAKDLLSDASNHESPTFEKSRARVKELGGKQGVHDYHTSRACAAANVRQNELPNDAFAENMVAGLPVANEDDQVTVAAWKALVKNKIAAHGITDNIGRYDDNIKLINDFWSSNSLSTLQNPAPGIIRKATPSVIPAAY